MNCSVPEWRIDCIALTIGPFAARLWEKLTRSKGSDPPSWQCTPWSRKYFHARTIFYLVVAGVLACKSFAFGNGTLALCLLYMTADEVAQSGHAKEDIGQSPFPAWPVFSCTPGPGGYLQARFTKNLDSALFFEIRQDYSGLAAICRRP